MGNCVDDLTNQVPVPIPDELKNAAKDAAKDAVQNTIENTHIELEIDPETGKPKVSVQMEVVPGVNVEVAKIEGSEEEV